MSQQTPEYRAMVGQMVVRNMRAINTGVGRITAKARLGADVHDDLVADTVLAILERKGHCYNPEKASEQSYCRMIAFQVALDKLRAMKRGGQFSGAYAGFGNVQLDKPDDDGTARTQLAATNENQWLNEALAQVSEVLPMLTNEERALWELLASGEFNAEKWSAKQGIEVATAYVRANRLRAKIRELLKGSADLAVLEA